MQRVFRSFKRVCALLLLVALLPQQLLISASAQAEGPIPASEAASSADSTEPMPNFGSSLSDVTTPDTECESSVPSDEETALPTLSELRAALPDAGDEELGQLMELMSTNPDQSYILHFTYHFNDAGSTSAADFEAYSFAENTPVDLALPNVYNLTPSTVPAGYIVPPEDSTGPDSQCHFRVPGDWSQFKQDFPAVVSGRFQIINIPVSYAVEGTSHYRVIHLLEQPDGTYAPAQDADGNQIIDCGSVIDSLIVSLQNTPAGQRTFNGYEMSPKSREDIKRYIIAPNPDESTVPASNVIELRYTRKAYSVDYATDGGTLFDSKVAHYHDCVGDYIPSQDPVRAGYRFDGWYAVRPPLPKRPQGSENRFVWCDPISPEQRIEDDITFFAKWVVDEQAAPRTVKLVYWMQDANGPDLYYSIGSQMVNQHADHTPLRADDIFDYTGYCDLAQLQADRKVELLDDPAYFHFNQEKTAQMAAGNQYVKGSNGQIINIFFNRNEYKLIFHLGQKIKESFWPHPVNDYVATGFHTNGSDWTSHHVWEYVDRYISQPPSLTIHGREYHITNDDSGCYTITARYGQSITSLWPTQVTSSLLKDFAGWSTEKIAPNDSNSFIGIVGTHSTMDELLIKSPQDTSDTGAAHHLVAMFGYTWNTTTRIYHYFEEAPASAPDSKPSSIYTDGCTPFQAKISNPDGSLAGYTDLTPPSFLAREFHTVQGEGKGSIDEELAAAFPYRHLVFASRKTEGSTEHIYYVYRHTTHNLTLDHNLPNQASSQQHISYTQLNHREQFAKIRTPDPLSGYRFKGWFLDPGGHEAVCPPNQTDPSQWVIGAPNYNVPDADTTLYAKWVRQPVSITMYLENDWFSDQQLADLARAIRSANQRLSSEIKLIGPAHVGPDQSYSKYVLTDFPYNTPFPDEVWGVIANGPAGNNLLKYPTYPPGSWHLVDPDDIGNSSRHLYDPTINVVRDRYITCVPERNMDGRIKLIYQDENHQPISRDPNDPSHTWDLIYADQDGSPVLGPEPGTVGPKQYPVGLKMRPIPASHIPGFVPTQRSVSGVTVKAPDLSRFSSPEDDPTEVVMTYTKAASLSYTVHHVLAQQDGHGQWIDYGNGVPPADAVELRPPQATVLELPADANQLNQAGQVTAHFDCTLTGYTVLAEQVKQLMLTDKPELNHIYFYYTSNRSHSYTLNFYLGDAMTGAYPATPSCRFMGSGPSGRITLTKDMIADLSLYLPEARTPADRAALQSLIAELAEKNHELDPDRSDPELFIGSNPEGNVLNIYLKRIPWAYFYFRNGTWPSVRPPVSGLAPDQYEYLYDTNTGSKKLIGCRIRYEIGDSLPEPLSPTPPQLQDKMVEYRFLGWSETSPDTDPPPAYITDGHADVLQDVFDKDFKYSFNQPVSCYTLTLYAVYNPRLTYFSLVKLDQESGKPLSPDSGFEFTLSRLVAEQVDGVWRPRCSPSGDYEIDTSFPPQTEHGAWQQGQLQFLALAAGFYQLVESKPPTGYAPLNDVIVVYVNPSDMSASLYRPQNAPHISAKQEPSNRTSPHLVLYVGNTYQYRVTMDAPAALNFTYAGGNLIWDPVSLSYVQGPDGGHWTQDSTGITVTNKGPQLRMSVSADLNQEYRQLIPMLTVKSGGMVQSARFSIRDFLLEQEQTAVVHLGLSGVPQLTTHTTNVVLGRLTFAFDPNARVDPPCSSAVTAEVQPPPVLTGRLPSS